MWLGVACLAAAAASRSVAAQSQQTGGAVRRLATEAPTCGRLMALANGGGGTFATNMRSCFSTDTHDAANHQWPSAVGGYVGTFSGTAVTVDTDAAGTNGAVNQDQPYLSGTTASKVAFGEIKGAGSFCSKTRYTGSAKMRILQGQTHNWLHGHYATGDGDIWGPGVAYYQKWIIDSQELLGPNTNWVTMCCQNAGPSCWVNGVKYTGDTATGGVMSVSINQGLSTEQVSDWGAAFVVSWDYDLGDAQMEMVQHLLMSTFEFTAAPTLAPTSMPTAPSPVPTTVYEKSAYNAFIEAMIDARLNATFEDLFAPALESLFAPALESYFNDNNYFFPEKATGACYSSESTVSVVGDGKRKLKDIEEGDIVVAGGLHQQMKHSKVLAIYHSKPKGVLVHLTVKTHQASRSTTDADAAEDQSALDMAVTEYHTFPGCGPGAHAIQANNIQVSDCLLTVHGRGTVTSVKHEPPAAGEEAVTVVLSNSDVLAVGGVLTHAKRADVEGKPPAKLAASNPFNQDYSIFGHHHHGRLLRGSAVEGGKKSTEENTEAKTREEGEAEPACDARVKALLDSLGLSKFAAVFAKEDVTMEALRLMDKEDLQKMGVTAGARVLIVARATSAV